MHDKVEVKRYGWNSAQSLADHVYTLPAILKMLPRSKGLRILDAGCGNGYISSELARRGHSVIGVDAAEDGIEICRQTYGGSENLSFHCLSIYDSELQSLGSFDAVVSAEVIEHLFSPQKFLNNMFALLKNGGLIILTTPYHGYMKNLALSVTNKWDKHFTVHWEGGHIKFFSRKTLSQALEKSGFENFCFMGAGRLPGLWKSMVVRARKP